MIYVINYNEGCQHAFVSFVRNCDFLSQEDIHSVMVACIVLIFEYIYYNTQEK